MPKILLRNPSEVQKAHDVLAATLLSPLAFRLPPTLILELTALRDGLAWALGEQGYGISDGLRFLEDCLKDIDARACEASSPKESNV
jgi:hypothetical protein